MGLDMYLVLDKGRKGSEEIERIWESDEFWNNKHQLKDGEFDGLTLMYWRKAFGILGWFDKNLKSVQDEADDETLKDERDREGCLNCRYYHVTKKELDELLSECKEVWATKNLEYDEQYTPDDLMPVGKGFFIGGYRDINDWWWSDIENTVENMEKGLKNVDWDNDDVYFIISY